ncbi:RlpA-like double-psi beta-barrel-protein domain-containing protein-containing protein [Xylariomycetidae sp. FL0641]|nr:RlpA-like double-psi beta-barrel-protein domain-containing protein-containing protein [Xylariomycetidae sp. FL0641]
MRTTHTLAALLALLSPSLAHLASRRAIAKESEQITGTSTFYGGNLHGGMCSFANYDLPSGIYGTAYSGSSWNHAAKCGTCLEVSANGRSITVMVRHLDLFEDAFDILSPTSSDPLATSYTEVECAAIKSPLVLHNKSGTSAYWFSMQVVNSKVPVATLEVSTDSGQTWQATTRSDYNFFENQSGFGTSKVDVRVTSSAGDTVVVQDVTVESDAQTTASSNF